MIGISTKTHTFGERFDPAVQVNAHNREAIFAALTTAGARTVIARFSGDEGQVDIDCIEAYAGAEGGDNINLPATPLTIQVIDRWDNPTIKDRTEPLESAIGTVCFEYLEQQHSVMCDENLWGTLRFDAAKKTIKLDFNVGWEFNSTDNF